jgi:hypothetical protein
MCNYVGRPFGMLAINFARYLFRKKFKTFR